MFGLGMTEILMILAIALIVVGPKKLPELAKTLGRAMGEFKRSAQDFKRSIDLEGTVKDIEVPKTDIKDILNDSDKPEPEPEKTDNTEYTRTETGIHSDSGSAPETDTDIDTDKTP